MEAAGESVHRKKLHIQPVKFQSIKASFENNKTKNNLELTKYYKVS